MTDKIDFTPDYGQKENSNIIKVLGVGGGGSNAVAHMYSDGIVGVDFLVCNTDQGHLNKCCIPEQLLLGTGLGAGAKPEVATQYAMESKDKIKEFIGSETKMLFITAGMGKGTGTGASPVIAEIAHEMGILTIGVVTAPFIFEGKSRQTLANEGIEKMSEHIDSLIVVKNENILKLYQDLTISKAYEKANDVLKNAVKCIAELITVNYDQNVDFNDIKTIMKDSGKAMLGLAQASGEGRVEKVIEDALNCPLLDDSAISEAQNFLFFISYGPDNPLKISELSMLTERFESMQAQNAHVIWGQGEDPTLGDALKLSVIVTRFNGKNEEQETISLVNTENNNEPLNLGEIKVGQSIDLTSNPIPTISPINNPVATTPFDNTVDTRVERPTTSVETDTPRVVEPITQTSYTQQPIQTPAQPTNFNSNPTATFQQGPTKVVEHTNVIVNDDNFQTIIERPAIERRQQTLTNNYAAKTAIETQQEQGLLYEVDDDRAIFFTSLVD